MRPFPMNTPTVRIVAQFRIIKTKPARIGDERETTDSSFPVWASRLRNPSPSPSKILKTGPAKQAVIAMFASPFRAIVIFALRSPTEFPQARMVRPIMAPGMCKMMPMKFSRATKRSAMKSIHVAAITKP
ncbi:unnamed protein product [Pseudo-nitzschia multistriata]|uniref:Uncharacterized protein n=1 Tax=Pseudo-nitzschia multistriata TaxID=183589 RepID=A0A448ZIB6_9STRA|nr:unnamed protein product [Pseudo-nitzschia multistriata]